jgi:hypothetical protein
VVHVNKRYDIPYLAGYSQDGKTIYIDRDMPEILPVGKHNIKIADFLLETHEHIEKALEQCGLDYKHSHKFATTYEHYVAMKHGIDPALYEQALKPHEDFAYKKRDPYLPHDLDPQPYVGDSHFKRWFR